MTPNPRIQRRWSTHLLEHPVAARSIRRDRAPADDQQRLRQHWRERVAMILSEYT